jgi:hypothetical protein
VAELSSAEAMLGGGRRMQPRMMGAQTPSCPTGRSLLPL